MFILLAESLFHFCIYKPLYPGLAATADFSFYFIVATSICIAAAGYIINDYFDVNIDQVNKPQSVVVGAHRGHSGRKSVSALYWMNEQYFASILTHRSGSHLAGAAHAGGGGAGGVSVARRGFCGQPPGPDPAAHHPPPGHLPAEGGRRLHARGGYRRW